MSLIEICKWIQHRKFQLTQQLQRIMKLYRLDVRFMMLSNRRKLNTSRITHRGIRF
jgi:hypothetical protein